MVNTDNSNVNISDSEDLSLQQILLIGKTWLKYFVTEWKVILLLGMIGGVIGFLYAYPKKFQYTSSTTFVLEEKSGGGGMLSQLGGLAGIAGLDISSGGGIFQGENIIELYRSRRMLQKTLLSPVDSTKGGLLIDRYLDFTNLRQSWNKDPQLENISFEIESPSNLTRLHDSILNVVINTINKNNLVVNKPDKKLNIIQVKVTSPDEIFSQAFNVQLVANVNDFYVQTKTKRSLDNVNILQRKTDSVMAVMNTAIYNAVAVSDATPNSNPTRQVQKMVPIQRSQISVETSKAILSELVKNLEMSKMALLQETPLIQIIDGPVLPLPKDKVSKFWSLIIGGICGGFLASIYVVGKKVFNF